MGCYGWIKQPQEDIETERDRALSTVATNAAQDISAYQQNNHVRDLPPERYQRLTCRWVQPTNAGCGQGVK